MSYLWYWTSGGWDFEQWRSRSAWRPVSTPQSGSDELVPLAGRASAADWERARAYWSSVVNEVLGDVTDVPPRTAGFDLIESGSATGYRMRRVRYALTEDESGYAWLLVPNGLDAPSPAVIALHQTVPQGKDEPVGLSGDPDLAYACELVERGFVVVAPDAIGFGERRADHPHARYRHADKFFAAHPTGSVMAKMVYDVSRLIDAMETLPEVDATRIGCIGHSHGGYGTLYAMVGEPRIRAGVVSCGITAFRTDPTPERWWRRTALIPRLGYYEDDIRQTPFDFHHLVALIAPRPLMVSAALNDAIFPNTANIPHLLDLAGGVYAGYGAANSLRQWVFRGDHRFPRAARTRAYRMLTEALRR